MEVFSVSTRLGIQGVFSTIDAARHRADRVREQWPGEWTQVDVCDLDANVSSRVLYIAGCIEGHIDSGTVRVYGQ